MEQLRISLRHLAQETREEAIKEIKENGLTLRLDRLQNAITKIEELIKNV